MIGQTISHYKILEKLGEGGMGVVYKAQDLKLDRLVALKFLPAHLASDDQDKKRFIHEAKAASSLDHPNICNVHEIDETPDGQVFIVMAIYEGTPLNKKIEKGPLKIDEALDVVIQAAEGLQAAHEKGIVHRDVKSSNIMMTDKGHAVIMDFGLARTGGATKLTKTGSTLGTVPYMSPEQARGEKVDHRTDIWSLGVVLYEMISGRLPFQSPYSEAIVYSILNEEPKPFSLARNDVPAEVENVVRKCLQKNPSNRYQHADELIVDLRRVKTELGKEAPSLKIAKIIKFQWRNWYLIGGAALVVGFLLFVSLPLSTTNDEVIRSIAVLPLDNLSRDPEQEYFVDGMADALNTELWKIGALKVISRSSAMLYKGVKKPLPEIARELGVDGLITGSVLREGEQVRITVQLIDGSTDRQLWVESYQRELHGILALHTEVAQAIAREIKIKLTPFEEARLMSVRRVDERAYDTYLKGLYHYNTFTQDGLKKAISLYEQSVQIDSTYAPAYAGLANTYNVMGAFGIIPWPQPVEKAKLATHKALELDSTLAEAHVSLAIISDLEWNWSQAEREWKRANELSPGSLLAPEWYLTHLLNLRRFDEAIVVAKRMETLNPLSLNARTMAGWPLVFSGRYAEAMAKFQAVLELDSNHNIATHNLGQIYLVMGKYDEAIAAFKKAITLYGKDAQWSKAFLGVAYARAGETEHALEVIEEMKKSYSTRGNVSPAVIALLYLGLGDKEEAMQWSNRAFDARDPQLPGVIMQIYGLKLLPQDLRDDPRFIAMMKNMGLQP